MTKHLGDGHTLVKDKSGLRLLYQSEEIAQPISREYALRVIVQHRPPGKAVSP
jgi:hypothetical protein